MFFAVVMLWLNLAERSDRADRRFAAMRKAPARDNGSRLTFVWALGRGDRRGRMVLCGCRCRG